MVHCQPRYYQVSSATSEQRTDVRGKFMYRTTFTAFLYSKSKFSYTNPSPSKHFVSRLSRYILRSGVNCMSSSYSKNTKTIIMLTYVLASPLHVHRPRICRQIHCESSLPHLAYKKKTPPGCSDSMQVSLSLTIVSSHFRHCTIYLG